MQKDTSLEQLFSNFRPQMDSSPQFMSALQRRLDAVEYLRQYQLKQKRHQRVLMLVCLVLGLLLGGAAMTLVLVLPAHQPITMLTTSGDALGWMQEHFRLLVFIPLVAFVCYMVILFVKQLQDLLALRQEFGVRKNID